jgi:hypothetical protein
MVIGVFPQWPARPVVAVGVIVCVIGIVVLPAHGHQGALLVCYQHTQLNNPLIQQFMS